MLQASQRQVRGTSGFSNINTAAVYRHHAPGVYSWEVVMEFDGDDGKELQRWASWRVACRTAGSVFVCEPLFTACGRRSLAVTQ